MSATAFSATNSSIAFTRAGGSATLAGVQITIDGKQHTFLAAGQSSPYNPDEYDILEAAAVFTSAASIPEVTSVNWISVAHSNTVVSLISQDSSQWIGLYNPKKQARYYTSGNSEGTWTCEQQDPPQTKSTGVVHIKAEANIQINWDCVVNKKTIKNEHNSKFAITPSIPSISLSPTLSLTLPKSSLNRLPIINIRDIITAFEHSDYGFTLPDEDLITQFPCLLESFLVDIKVGADSLTQRQHTSGLW
ncbi:hypothetical protein RhiJN_07988 [Ceratobasidium sp. AG-Ba]|nr:hypothetical protein RhiJN_07988 [Ceratobasidium sp. AG-Ba]